MLSASDRSKFRAAQESVLDMLGVPAAWAQTKAPNATKNVTVGFKTIGAEDTELINSYGIGSKLFTVKTSDIPLIEKFDTLTIMSERYTIDSVFPIHINGEHVFHKLYVRGR